MADTFSLQLVAYNDVVNPGYYGWRFTINCKQTRNYLQNTSLIEWEIKQEPNGLNIVYFPEVDETSLTIGEEEVYHDENPSIVIIPGDVYGSVAGSFTVSHDENGELTLPVTFVTGDKSISGSWELTKMPEPSRIYQNPAQIGNMATLVIATDTGSGWTHDVTYTFGKLSGTVVTGVPGGNAYTWTIPETFYDELGPDKSSMEGTLNCKTYYNGSYYGEYSTTFIASTFADDVPVIEVEIYDTDSAIVALTGDSSVLVPGYSDAYYNMTATPQNGASIASVKASNGSFAFNTSTGTFVDSKATKYTFSATDSRGLLGTETVVVPIVDYVKPTVEISDVYMDGNGELTFTLSGNCFSGSFGAVNNSPVVQYRYKKDGGSYGNWVTASPSFSGKSYSADITITGLDYHSGYTFQARIQDKLNLVESPLTPVNSKPIFDWSNEDFNFNVPVNVNGGITVSGDVEFGGSTSGLKAEDIEGAGLRYGTCSTGASTSAKVVTCKGFPVPVTGASIRVKFDSGNTASSPTMNVNSTGAYAIKSYGSTANMGYKWYSGEVKDFVFDGSYWVMVDGMVASTSYYGKTILTNTVDSTTQNKAVTPYGVQQAIQSALSGGGTTPTVGTWSPYCSGSGTKTGWYIKIGSYVILGFYIDITVSASSNTEISISGLPFSPREDAAGGGFCSPAYYSRTAPFTGWKLSGSYIKAMGGLIASFGSGDEFEAVELMYPSNGTKLVASGTICYYAYG